MHSPARNTGCCGHWSQRVWKGGVGGGRGKEKQVTAEKTLWYFIYVSNIKKMTIINWTVQWVLQENGDLKKNTFPFEYIIAVERINDAQETPLTQTCIS